MNSPFYPKYDASQQYATLPVPIRGVILVNTTGVDLYAADDRGTVFFAPANTIATWSVGTTMGITMQLATAVAVANQPSQPPRVILTDQDTTNSVAQLASLAQEGTGSGLVITRVTSLPATPVDNQIIEYVDIASGADWLMIYNASLGGWTPFGGVPLIGLNATDSTLGGAVYADPPSPGPSITMPLSGDWIFQLRFQTYNSTSAGSPGMGSLLIAGAISDADAAAAAGGGTAATSFVGAMATIRKTGLVAGVVKAQYRGVGGGGTNQHVVNRVLTAMPTFVH